jgi:hypothetical protein
MRYIAEENPPVVHVAYSLQGIGVTMDLANPEVVGDTLRGTRLAGAVPVAVPVKDVYSVAARRLDTGRTAMLATGIAIATGFFVYALVQDENGKNDWYCDYNDSVRGPNGEPLCGPMT